MGNSIAQQFSKEGVIGVAPISENHTDLSEDAIKDFLESFEIIQIVPSKMKDIELVEVKSIKTSEPILIPIPKTVTHLHNNKRGKKRNRKGGTRF